MSNQQSKDDLTQIPDPQPEKISLASGGAPDQKANSKPAAVVPEKAEVVVPAKPETVAPEKPEAAPPTKPVAVAPEKPEVAPPTKPVAVTPEKPEEAPPTKPVAVAPEKPEAAPPANIALVVDDEPANRDFLMRLLEQTGMQVKGASDGKEALDIAQRHDSMALLAIDHKLPDMEGVDLIHQLRERFPTACVVMATMLDERALMAQAFENGCNVFLVKPHGFMELFRRLQETGPDPAKLDRLIIDQYGLRPYRG